MLRNPLVIGPESLRSGEVDANALARELRIHGADVFRRPGELEPLVKHDALYHVAHTAVSADKYLDHDDYCKMFLIMPLAASLAPSPEPLITSG